MIGFLMDENEKMRKLVMELLDYSKLEYQKENHTEDEMYGKYVEGAAEVTKAEAQTQTQNGTATEATGTDISSWASYEDGETNFTLTDAASYRTKGASKATPGFDVIDYGQETYEFGSTTQDARHFDRYVLKVLQEEKETLEGLFNSNND